MKLRLSRPNYKNFSDEELVLAFNRTSDKSIIGEIYSRYAHLVLGSCLKYMKQFENAEDIAMKIFMDLEQKLLKHEIQFFKSWLYQVTKNECFQVLRKKGIVTSELSHENYGLEEEESETIELTDERIANLPEAINSLKGVQRDCIELFYIQQKSYVEISEEQQIPVNTVKSAIQNGKRNLKIWFEKNEK